MPNTHVRWRHAIAGGVFVAVGFELAKRGLAWYVGQVPTFAMVYGAFATVPILLIWIYLGWVIVLLGAVVAAYAPSLQMRVKRWPEAPGSRFHLAISVLRELRRVQAAPVRGLSSDQLVRGSAHRPACRSSRSSTSWWRSIGSGRLDEAGQPRFVLLCNVTTTPAQALLASLLLTPAAALTGFWRRAGFADMTLDELLQV